MKVITLKEYAEQNNVSYEAVRQQVNRYKNELGDHIIKDGRQQFLDEEAVVFLDGKREKNPLTIIQQNKDEAIEELERTKEQLLIKVAAQADRIAELAEWKADNALLIAQADQQRLLLEEARGSLAEERMGRIRAEEKAAAATKERDGILIQMKEKEEEHQKELQDLRDQLEQERKKTIWQRLFSR